MTKKKHMQQEGMEQLDEFVEGEELKDELSVENETLKTKVEELETEVSKLKNDYAKAYADTENIRRRLQNEADNAKKYRIQTFALDILPAIDNLERALESANGDENESFKKGVEMIYNQIKYALSKEGVEEVVALDSEFDPNFHQAIMVEKKEGVEPNVVIEVLQKGYKIKDRILRPAMVKVSE